MSGDNKNIQREFLQKSKFKRDIWGSYDSVVEDSGLLGCDAESLIDRLATFRRKVVPSSSRIKPSRLPTLYLALVILLDLPDPWILVHCMPSKHQEPLTQWHRVTSQKTSIPNFKVYKATIFYVFRYITLIPLCAPKLIFRNMLIFYGEELIAPRTTSEPEDLHLSAVRNC